MSVPGAVAGWIDAHDRYGSMNFAELLSTGIDYARNGFAVSSRLAQDFEEQGQNLNDAGRDLYLPNSNPPKVGSLLRNPQLANSLRLLPIKVKRVFITAALHRSSPPSLRSRVATCVRVILPHILQHGSLL